MQQVADLLKHLVRRLRLDRQQNDVAELRRAAVVHRALDPEPLAHGRDPLLVSGGREDGPGGDGAGVQPAADQRPAHLARADHGDAGFAAPGSVPVDTRSHLLVSL